MGRSTNSRHGKPTKKNWHFATKICGKGMLAAFIVEYMDAYGYISWSCNIYTSNAIATRNQNS